MPMRWEDERYVRLYTRDTVDWLSLSFEAQGLLSLILRKVDRAGVLELGRHGPTGVAVAVGHPHRHEVIVPALQELLDDGCIEIRGDRLIVRNFIEAQEAAQSDAARQRAHRERARDLARAGLTVEHPGGVSQNVTKSHAQSRAVTPSLPSLPSRAVPPEPDPPLPPGGEEGGTGREKRGKKPEQLTIADRVDAAGGAPPAAQEAPAPAPPASGTPMTVRAFLEAVATTSGGRFQVSHKNRQRERRNPATEDLTCGLPQHLWDRLRAEIAQEQPTLDDARALGHALALRRGDKFVLWGQWLVVTADQLAGRVHEGLTAAMTLVAPEAGSDLPPITAEPNTAEFYAQLRARTEARHGPR